MRILIPEPGRQCPRIRPADRVPGVVRDVVQVVGLDVGEEEGEVRQRLFL